MSDGQTDWVGQQKRAFTSWANERLRRQSLVPGLPELKDITAELEDGVHLTCLMHTIFPQHSANTRKFKEHPKNAFEKKLNVEYALSLAEEDGVRAPLTKVSHFTEVCDGVFFSPFFHSTHQTQHTKHNLTDMNMDTHSTTRR